MIDYLEYTLNSALYTITLNELQKYDFFCVSAQYNGKFIRIIGDFYEFATKNREVR